MFLYQVDKVVSFGQPRNHRQLLVCYCYVMEFSYRSSHTYIYKIYFVVHFKKTKNKAAHTFANEFAFHVVVSSDPPERFIVHLDQH